MDLDDFEDLFEEIGSSAYSSQETAADVPLLPLIGLNATNMPVPSHLSSITGNSSMVDDVDIHRTARTIAVTHPSGRASDDTAIILRQIDSIFTDLMDERTGGSQMTISLRRRDIHARRRNPSRQSPRQATDNISSSISFPGKTEIEAWRFAVIIRILEIIQEALENDVVISKRDIYYKDPALFNKQSVVDRYVDDIAFTFGATRSSLNVMAVAKGLITGAISFCRRNGSTIRASEDNDGMLVPNLHDVLSADMQHVRWILVVEKEATFRSIVSSKIFTAIAANGIIITAKGYPDVATRVLLRFLSTPSPQNNFASPPIYGLVDYDPDGLAILSTYKHGSAALAHERPSLCVPQMQWLGLRGSGDILSSDYMNASQGLLALRARDRHKAVSMLDWECLSEEGDIRVELQRMLMLNTKAELEMLDVKPSGMEELLNKMVSSS